MEEETHCEFLDWWSHILPSNRPHFGLHLTPASSSFYGHPANAYHGIFCLEFFIFKMAF